MKRLFFLLSITLCFTVLKAQIRIASYNVENLFDTKHDTLKLDEDFTPEGKYRWNISRYNTKIDNLSRVLVSIGGWQNCAVIGLCEVENEQCLKDLLNKGGLKNLGYKYIHQESPDERGIDCALLYDPQQFKLLNHRFIPVPMPQTERPTRDIVYASGIVKHRQNNRTIIDTLHIMMCHLPSQLGGAKATAHKRKIAHSILNITIDSIRSLSRNAKIIIMGDMNSEPDDFLTDMHNMMLPLLRASHGDKGTHKWKGTWSYLDQFFVSPSLINNTTAHVFDAEWILQADERYGGLKPMRCYQYITWQAGYSDHLPIYIDVRF